MRKQSARQTILTLLAWLVFLNFNTASPCKHHTTCTHPGLESGKGIESYPVETVYAKGQKARGERQGAAYRIKKVVLDAGHGGKDPGCLGASSKEKHNALAIVLKLGALIQAEYPEVEVIYTRTTDVFVELNERAAIANRNNADLFISVHCNSISVSYVKGVETYVMGLHTADSNLEVAKRENASIFLEDNYKKNYGGYDPNSAEAHIFGSVWQSAYLEQSILFAGFVQQFTKGMARRDDRGVKQAGFIVLHKTAMPSVLVEAGFLTNRDEEKFIASEEGQFQMADAIFEAFRAYKAKMESTPLAARKHTNKAQLAATLATETPPDQPTAPAAIPVSIKTPPPATVNAPPVRAGNQYADEQDLPAVSQKKAADAYRIHLMSWGSRLDRNTGQLSLLGDVKEEQSGGQFHYFTGTFAARTDAEKMLPEIHNLGFRTARVVARAE
ncbi:MAG: N-acetylmuramoyl-L-alanine amidase [Lewinellaceae bacterium]|nr:N-acetylmuramoyl-L-alanine amidase [Lewinellaceae bacterium]